MPWLFRTLQGMLQIMLEFLIQLFCLFRTSFSSCLFLEFLYSCPVLVQSFSIGMKSICSPFTKSIVHRGPSLGLSMDCLSKLFQFIILLRFANNISMLFGSKRYQQHRPTGFCILLPTTSFELFKEVYLLLPVHFLGLWIEKLGRIPFSSLSIFVFLLVFLLFHL
jgi:hypothetical protein